MLSQIWRRLSLGLATLAVLLAGTAIARKSVTVDESQALPSGLAMLGTGDFHYPEGTPPLSQILPALPAFLQGARVPEIPGMNANWGVADAFAKLHAGEFHSAFFAGRLVSLCVLFATLLLVYALAERLYGPVGGTLATAAAALNPTLLAHGALITPDIYLACGFMVFLWALDRYAENPRARKAAALGASLGLACLSKFTALVLFPLLPPLLAAVAPGRAVARNSALAAGAALVVIHAGYAFHGMLPLAGSLGLHAMLPAWLPLPFPADFVRAADAQLAESPYLAYLLGETNYHGFFLYYAIGFLVKSPAGFLLLALLASLCGKRPSRREIPMVALGLLFLLFFSLARYKNLGIRYLLFLYPWAAVWIGRLAPALTHAKARLLRGATALCLASLVLGTALAWPDYLAYFNLPSGGPDRGHRILLDSNLDWGQDLTTLKDFMVEKGIDTVALAHFGRVDPALYGIRFTTLNGLPASRYIAISANFLWGRTYFVNGTLFYPSSTAPYTPYRNVEPLAVLGHTIYVYDALAIPQLRGLVR